MYAKNVVARFCLSVISFALFFSLSADAEAQFQPFHLKLMKYEKNPADGTYRFTLHFRDLVIAIPHVRKFDDPKPTYDYDYKIGDFVGKYKIVQFTIKKVSMSDILSERKPLPDDYDGPCMDFSYMTLQRVDKPENQIQVAYLTDYDLPDAAIAR